MGKGEKEKDIDALLKDIEVHMDKGEKKKSGKTVKDFLPTPQKVMAKSDNHKKYVETDKQFDQMRKTLVRQQTKITKYSTGINTKLIIATTIAIAIIILFYINSMSLPEPSSELIEKARVDPVVPVDSATGDVFKEEREEFNAAKVKLSKGDYSGTEDLKSFVKKNPKSPNSAKSLLLMAATYRYNLGNNKEAIKAFTEFLKLFPKHKQANTTRKHLIKMLVDAGDEPGAMEHAKILLDEVNSEHDRTFAQHYLKKNQE